MYGCGEVFLQLLHKVRPKKILEIGVHTGVNAMNICETLKLFHKEKFQYVGLDLFEDYTEENDNEIAPASVREKQKFSNPLKHFYYNIVRNELLHSYESVSSFLKKFKTNVNLIKGNTKQTLLNLDLSDMDMCYVDGGHSFETVFFEVNYLLDHTRKDCLILCDDYIHGEAHGVKEAVDKIVKEKNLKVNVINNRFAEIIR